MMSQPTQDKFQAVTTERISGRVDIFVEGDKVVETKDAIRLFERGHDPVIYVPRDAVENIQLIKYDTYHCPHKGKADLFHIKHNGRIHEKAAWSYIDTYEDVTEIRNYVAFYPSKVQAIKVIG